MVAPLRSLEAQTGQSFEIGRPSQPTAAEFEQYHERGSDLPLLSLAQPLLPRTAAMGMPALPALLPRPRRPLLLHTLAPLLLTTLRRLERPLARAASAPGTTRTRTTHVTSAPGGLQTLASFRQRGGEVTSTSIRPANLATGATTRRGGSTLTMRTASISGAGATSTVAMSSTR